MIKPYVLKQFKSFRLIANEAASIQSIDGPVLYACVERNVPDALGNDSWQQEKCDFDLIQELAEPYFHTGSEPVEK